VNTVRIVSVVLIIAGIIGLKLATPANNPFQRTRRKRRAAERERWASVVRWICPTSELGQFRLR
jgi:hypothetical protein